MAGITISISDKEFEDFLEEELEIAAEEIFANSQDIIIQNNIVDEGTLLKSGTINKFQLRREIVYAVPYADIIEYGRIPGSMPPLEPIMNWVKRKLRVTNENEVKRIANLIRWDIYQNGTEPRPFLQPAIEKYLAKR